jgi:hypothetical protein
MAAAGKSSEVVAATPIMVFQFIGLDFRILLEPATLQAF